MRVLGHVLGLAAVPAACALLSAAAPRPRTTPLRAGADDYLAQLDAWAESTKAAPAAVAAAPEAPTVAGWRQTCDATGVVSYYDYGLELSAPAAAPAPAAEAPTTAEALAAVDAALAPASSPEDRVSAVAGAAVLAATAAALGLDVEVATLAAAAAAAASINDETSSLGQLTRAAGRLAAKAYEKVKPVAADALAKAGEARPPAPATPPKAAPKISTKAARDVIAPKKGLFDFGPKPAAPAEPVAKETGGWLNNILKPPTPPPPPPPPPPAGPFDFLLKPKAAPPPPPPPPPKAGPFEGLFKAKAAPPAAKAPATPKAPSVFVPPGLRKAAADAQARAAAKASTNAATRKSRLGRRG